MSTKSKRNLAVVMFVLALLLMVNSIAFGALKLTAVLRSWDDAAGRYENGNLTLYLDGQPHPFYEELGWDNGQVTDACGPGTSTTYAGTAEFGIYHTDNNPAGAKGFQSTDDWSLVPCSVFDTKKYPDPGDILAVCDDPLDLECQIIDQDTVDSTVCGGNCENEIVTHVSLNLDTDCDGNIDPGFTDTMCLYWTAEKPPFPADTYWGGNIQARINDGGGDKTLNFNQILGPNAVTVQSLIANPAFNVSLLAVMAVALLMMGTAVVLLRRTREV